MLGRYMGGYGEWETDRCRYTEGVPSETLVRYDNWTRGRYAPSQHARPRHCISRNAIIVKTAIPFYKPSAWPHLTMTSFSEAMTTQCTHSVHLLVLIHGMWGNPSHLASMHRIMKETRILQDSEQDGVTLHVMIPETNKDESTYDGIDWGGERVAAEASAFVHTHLYNISDRPSTDFSGN